MAEESQPDCLAEGTLKEPNRRINNVDLEALEEAAGVEVGHSTQHF